MDTDTRVHYTDTPIHFPQNRNTPTMGDLLLTRHIADLGHIGTSDLPLDHVLLVFQLGGEYCRTNPVIHSRVVAPVLHRGGRFSVHGLGSSICTPSTLLRVGSF